MTSIGAGHQQGTGEMRLVLLEEGEEESPECWTERRDFECWSNDRKR